MKSKGSLITVLLVLVLILQAYIMLSDCRNFQTRIDVKEKKYELQVLLRGRDPGVPAPEPGSEPEIDDRITVSRIGPNPRPVMAPVAFGEGGKIPVIPKSIYGKRPKVRGIPEDSDIFMTIDSDNDMFPAIIYGIIILEEEPDLALTPKQAHALMSLFDLKKKLIKRNPGLFSVIYKTLTDEQLRYIHLLKYGKRKNRRPLPPEYIEKNAVETEKLLRKRL